MSKPTSYAASLGPEELRLFVESDEYKSFRDGLDRKISALLAYVNDNYPRFGCSIVLGAVTVSGASTYRDMSAAAGNTCGLCHALLCLLNNPDCGKTLTEVAIHKIINE